VGNTEYEITITTINEDGPEGIEWIGGVGPYGIDVEADWNNNGTIDYSEHLYTRLLGPKFKRCVAYADHGTAEQFTRYRF
jgi:hypothetical protein